MAEDVKSAKSTIKDCFIIMPITTPEPLVHLYKGDPDHFKHVLECLFAPAIEKAGLKLIGPIAKGAELIQARIIKYIEKSGLILCDISSLNPNVFFELGVRTALNKPLCLIKDDVTDKIPFDTDVIYHHTYKSSLNTWEIQNEITGLANHITETISTSGTENDLWKHFALRSIAPPLREDFGSEEKLDYILKSINLLRDDFAIVRRFKKLGSEGYLDLGEYELEVVQEKISRKADYHGEKILMIIDKTAKTIEISPREGPISESLKLYLDALDQGSHYVKINIKQQAQS